MKRIVDKFRYDDRFKENAFNKGLVEGLEAMVDANGRNTFDKQVEKITDKILEEDLNRVLKYAANKYALENKLREIGKENVRQMSPFEQAKILDSVVLPSEDEQLGNLLDAIKDGRVSIEYAVDKFNNMWGVK